MYCTKCGNKLSKGALFCTKCGTKISDNAEYCCGTNVAYGERVGGKEPAHDGNYNIENASISLLQMDRDSSSHHIKLVVNVDNPCTTSYKFPIRVDGVSVGKQKAGETAEYCVSLGKHTVCIGNAVIEIDIPHGGMLAELDFHWGPNMHHKIVCRQSEWVTKPSEIDSLAFFKNASVWGKTGYICFAACDLIGLIFLVLIIFSSVVSTLIAVLLGCMSFGMWRAWKNLKVDYESGIFYVPEGMSPQILLESLAGKFNYPYFKGIRYGIDGECIIDGRYASYKVVFHDDGSGALLAESKYGISIMLEAKALRSYLNKFFDPTRQIDPNVDLQRLEKMGKINLTGNIISKVFRIVQVAITIMVVVTLVRPEGFDKLLNIASPGIEVRQGYLSQYSSYVTIEEAFNNFFSNAKWSTYTSRGYDYVLFSGNCYVFNESADVRIHFKITGEHFKVDSIEINETPVGILMQDAILQSVYEDY